MSAYSVLADPSSQIRLLELQPGAYDDPIACSLRTTELSKDNSYEALSYVWGADEISCQISLGAKPFGIRADLENALRRLRDTQSARVLWIDAICINQEDIPERNAQVGIMRRIYSNAENVLVWLGEARDNSDLVMTERGIIDNFHAIDAEMWKAVMKGPRWNAFCQILERPWWRRTWIIQELAFARSVRVFCGEHSLEWNTIGTNIILYAQILENMGEMRDSLPIPESLDYSIELILLRGKFEQNARKPDMNLMDLMQWFRRCEATDPRDKVFGLLGLAKDNIDAEFGADYALSVSEVYRRTTEYFIRKHVSFATLGLKGSDASTSQHHLPSWVPDWNKELSFSPFPEIYRVSGESGLDFEFTQDGQEMSVTAAMMGDLGLCMPVGLADKEHWRAIEQILVNMMERSNWLFYPDEQATREAFRRTLLADNVSGTRLSEEDYIRYSAWFDRNPELDKGTPHDMEEGKGEIVEISTREYIEMVQTLIPEVARGLNPWRDKQAEEDDHKYYDAINAALRGRGLFFNRNYFIGIASAAAEKGDVLCIPSGAKIPWIVREVDGGAYKFVGECYVHGIMDGEIMDSLTEDSVKRITIT